MQRLPESRPQADCRPPDQPDRRTPALESGPDDRRTDSESGLNMSNVVLLAKPKTRASIIDSEIERGVFIDRTDAERNTLGDLLQRYLIEVSSRLAQFNFAHFQRLRKEDLVAPCERQDR